MKRQDPRGYYKVLRVPPNASAEAIKRAFRTLAVECHPDRNPHAGASAAFKTLSEAYGVLSDVRQRAKYDGRPFVPPASDAPDARHTRANHPGRRAADKVEPKDASASPSSREPIHCSCCDRATAQPRSASYWTVVSIVITWRRATRGVFCAACANKIGLRCTAISAAFGWWGPLGFFWTPISIYRNAVGGERQEDSDADLLWHNALAFLLQGKLTIAHALARQVAAAKSVHALDASDMLVELHRAGVPRDTPSLVDPWKMRRTNVAAQAALGLAGPVALAAFVLIGARPFEALATPAYATSFSPIAPVVTATKAARNIIASRMTLKTDTTPSPPTCAKTPEDGALIDGRLDPGKPGHHMEINNGTDGLAIVKVRDSITDHVRFSFFVKRGGHATVGPLPDGSYRIQYAIGAALAEDCRSLLSVERASEFPETKTFHAQLRPTGLLTDTLGFTLFSVPDGNVSPQAIDARKFLSD